MTTTASSTTCSYRPDGSYQPLRVRSWSGCCRRSPLPPRPGGYSTSCRISRPGLAWLTKRRPDLLGGLVRRSGPERPESRRCRSSIKSAWRGSCHACSMRRSSYLRSASGRCRRPTATGIRLPSTVPPIDHRLRTRRVTKRPVRRQFQLAGADLDAGLNVLLADALRIYGHYLGD